MALNNDIGYKNGQQLFCALGLQSLFYTLQQAYQVNYSTIHLFQDGFPDWCFSSVKPKNNWKLKKTILIDDKESNSRKCQELGLLLILVAVAILTYSSLIYFAEREGAQVNHDDDHLDVVGDG